MSFTPCTLSKEDFWPVARRLKPGLTRKQYDVMWMKFYDAVTKRAELRASLRIIQGGRA